jgi:16S rRNA G527 N7-methylase RsmG
MLGISMDQKTTLDKYADLLLAYTRNINVVSKKMTKDGLLELMAETEMVGRLVRTATIVDAGSGNGILGIPLALCMPDKRVLLVEPAPKKCNFLNHAIAELKIDNIKLACEPVQEFFHHANLRSYTIVARGFPDYNLLAKQLKSKAFRQMIIITSENKLKKLEQGLEKWKQTIYNIPGRQLIKIVTMENVSRET